jgi:hypothetical protein
LGSQPTNQKEKQNVNPSCSTLELQKHITIQTTMSGIESAGDMLFRRQASLCPAEKFVLRALLLDEGCEGSAKSKESTPSKRTSSIDFRHAHPEIDVSKHDALLATTTDSALTASILFSCVPPEHDDPNIQSPTVEQELNEENLTRDVTQPFSTNASNDKKFPRVHANRPSILGLWHAYEDGVKPQSLAKRSVLAARHMHSHSNGSHQSSKIVNVHNETNGSTNDNETTAFLDRAPVKVREGVDITLMRRSLNPSAGNLTNVDADDEASDCDSDTEVRRERSDEDDDLSSWGEGDHRDVYNTWELLKNEYAEEFGFHFPNSSSHRILNAKTDRSCDSQATNLFRILGTSADDASAQPHVLSPPLMDALMSFVPPTLRGQNYWLKYSLLRDGASLAVLQHYVRASDYVVLAIETLEGDVFGCFTSSPWRYHGGYFGRDPAFVWRMRHSRRTKVASLFDQAQLESIIDVYVYKGVNALLQVCHQNLLAVGGAGAGDQQLQLKCRSLPEKDSVPSNNLASDVLPLNAGDVSTLVDTSHCGFAIALTHDLLYGTTNPCSTFKSPNLCNSGKEGVSFEVANLEMWTFSPAYEINSAEKLEMTKYFIHHSSARLAASDSKQKDSTFQSVSQFSSRDLVQEDFYRRVGHDGASEERRNRWQDVNEKGMKFTSIPNNS